MNVNEENLGLAIHAALEGPEQRRLRIVENRFNVKPAKIAQNGDDVTVEGDEERYISRRRRGRPNDRIYYKFTKSGDNVKDLEISIDRGGLKRAHRRYSTAVDSAVKAIQAGLVATGTGGTKAAALFAFYQSQRSRMANEPTELRRAREEIENLLDGSWEGESAFLVANIAMAA